MTTSIDLAIANIEVNRMFNRKLENNTFFYEALIFKIGALLKRIHQQEAYALVSLYQIQESIHAVTNQFDDELDKFEALLEKKKQTRGKRISFEPKFYPRVDFSNPISVELVMLIELYDKLISTLKLLRTLGCFIDGDAYFVYLRRYFKTINQLLSQILLTPVKTLPTITCSELIDKYSSVNQEESHSGFDYIKLYRAMTSALAPCLQGYKKNPILNQFKEKLECSLNFNEANKSVISQQSLI